MRRELYAALHCNLLFIDSSTHATEGRWCWTRPRLAQLLQQRRRRTPRRFWVRPWILRRGGVSLGTSDASPSFREAYLFSNVAKIKNTAILSEVLPVTFALKLNAGQRWGSFLWLARTRTNSQTTRTLSYRCRDYPKKCRCKPVISRHYTVLCRSKS